MHEPQPQCFAEISLLFSFILLHLTCNLAFCIKGLNAAKCLFLVSCSNPFKINVQILYSRISVEGYEEN